ncbi:hypothetical protein Tco_0669883 [Tanacetum coccineum]
MPSSSSILCLYSQPKLIIFEKLANNSLNLQDISSVRLRQRDQCSEISPHSGAISRTLLMGRSDSAWDYFVDHTCVMAELEEVESAAHGPGSWENCVMLVYNDGVVEVMVEKEIERGVDGEDIGECGRWR